VRAEHWRDRRELVRRSEAQVTQRRMVIRPTAKGPVVFAIRFSDWHLVDAGVPMRHQPVFGKQPVLVPVGAEPLPTIVAIFIRVAHCDAVVRKGPQLLDEPVFVFLVPLAGQEGLRLIPICRELDAVSPARVERVGQGDLRCIARVPAVLGETHLLDRGLVGKRGERGSGHNVSFVHRGFRAGGRRRGGHGDTETATTYPSSDQLVPISTSCV